MKHVVVNPRAILNHRADFVNQFDRVFDDIIKSQFPDFHKEFGVSIPKSAYPKVNVYNKDDELVIIAEIPGLEKDDLNIEVEDNMIIISGDRHELDEDELFLIHKELKQSTFTRSIGPVQSEYFDLDNISAEFNLGILKMKVPKLAPEKPTKKKVTIQ